MKLSLPQHDVYFEQLLYPNTPIYNIGAKILIEGALNVLVLNKAYQHLINQHDTYRTVFNHDNAEISASFLNDFTRELPLMDFSEKANASEEANAFMQEEFIKPFNITSGKLLHKFILIRITSTKHYLFSVYHHIITDGWGTSLMFQRLVKNYNELIENGCVISEYPYSYKEFIKNDVNYQKSEDYQNDRQYWLNRFKVLPENLFEKISSNDKINKSTRKPIYVKRKQYNSINTLAKEFKVSTFHFILATLFLYFGRKYQNKDFAIGLPVLNRGKSIFKKTVGLFMGVSPLRIEMDFNSSFEKLLTDIRSQLRQDYRHQRFPLGKLVQKLNGFQEKERLFNITLSYEKQNYADHFLNTKTTVVPLSHQSERVALAIYIREFDTNEDVKIDFDYNLNYFNEDQILQVTSHFQLLLDNILNNPNKKLFEFEYLSEEERNKLLHTFNDTKTFCPNDQTFLNVFERQVQQYPNQLAVRDETTSLSYKGLKELSDIVAQNLLMCKDESKLIGVLLERSVYTIATLLGILKAGKSYIPLDPTFPINRLQYIINHSGLKTIISDQNENLSFQRCNIISLSEVLKNSEKKKEHVLPKVKPKDTAYIIYTSGSTGNPKGVEISHKSLLNFLLSIRKKPGIKPTDLLFAVTTYSFDISILEFFAPLISGACAYVASNKTLEDYSKAIETIGKISPSIIQATPSFYQLLINGGWQGDKKVKILCGGDLLSEGLASQLLENSSEVWNMYGPTETTIWSSIKKISSKKESSNIGCPIANTQFYVLDNYFQLLPVGSNGTLFIGGKGLAKGYFKDKELTTDKFIKNPFGKGLLYNTNDLVRWNENGELIFLGRNDSQVKIRGFRIELGDIEDKFNQIPQINKAVVVAKKEKGKEAFLAAYIQKSYLGYDIQDSISVLEKELPQYMIPYVLLEVDEFPLTPNKKIDRQKLTEQAIHSVTKHRQLPKTQLQKELALLWKDILNYNQEITIEDSFFTLGGHSLNAVKLAHRINKEYKCNIRLKTIFDYPTIVSLSNFLETIQKGNSIQIPLASQKEFYRVTPSQYQLWVASQTLEKSIAYNMVAVFEVKGRIYEDKIKQSVLKRIYENEILRTNFVEKEGEVYQKIKPVENIDFSISLIQTGKNEVKSHIEKYINEPFNLEQDLLLRMMLIQTGAETSLLVFCTHHIIMDGISLEFFTKQFIESYQTGKTTICQNRIQFKDYSEWLYNSCDTEKTTQFYQDYLKDYQVKESISIDMILPNDNPFMGSHYSIQFSDEQTNSLKQLAKQYESTPYNIVVTLINTIIYIVSDHKDIVIGTAHSGRSVEGIDSLIGMLVKTLPLRTKLTHDLTFIQLLLQVQKQLILLDEYQNIPFSIIKEDLFDILITYQNPDFSYQQEIAIDKAILKYIPIDTNYSRIPLLFNFFEVDSLLNLTISYDIDKYEESTIIFIIELFKKLLNTVTKEPSLKLSNLKEIIYENNQKEKTDFDFNF